MAYRDELEAAQARIAALERELAAERGKGTALVKADRGALVGRGNSALARGAAGSEAAQRWLGAPSRIELERVVDGELPERGYTELVECIRRALGNVGSTTVLPGSLAWSATAPSNGLGPFASVYFTVRNGKTVIRLDEKLANVAGAIFGGVGGGVGGGGIVLPILAGMAAPWLVPVTLAVWLGGTYASCRTLYRRSATKRADRLDKLLDELAEIAARYIAEAKADGDAET